MNIGRVLSVTDRSEWRTWLRKHCKREKEIWLIFYKKRSGRATISYEDAVEEALCFGWIDNLMKGIDETRYAQRFSPRRKGSVWSASNIKRLQRLAKQKKLTAAGRKAAQAVLGRLK